MKSAWDQFARALIARFGGVPKRVALQREATLARPFPDAWSGVLRRRSQHYRRLPPPFRQRFEQHSQLFLAEKRITAVDLDLTDETRLLVAASAATLTAGWPDYTWDQLSEVIVYPQNFDRDYSFDQAHVAGLAHRWGVVILSMPALTRSFGENSGGSHVGFHEFAHLLDLAGTLLAPGGILVYAVCSLLAEEGRDQAAAFTVRSGLVPETVPLKPGRSAGSGLLLTPGHDGTDGFFVARWRSPC